MASIGGVACHYVRDTVPANTLRMNTWNIPGLSGTGVQLLGYGDGDWEVRCEYFAATYLLADAWLASIQALKGSVVTIIDDFGTTSTYRLVCGFGPPKRYPAKRGGILGVKASIVVRGKCK